MPGRAQTLGTHQKRQQSYAAATTIGQDWGGAEKIVLDLRFASADNRSHPMPYRQIFLPHMKAFFQFLCPNPDCLEGGFDLTGNVRGMIKPSMAHCDGSLRCSGFESAGKQKTPCPIELRFRVEVCGVPVAAPPKRKAVSRGRQADQTPA